MEQLRINKLQLAESLNERKEPPFGSQASNDLQKTHFEIQSLRYIDGIGVIPKDKLRAKSQNFTTADSFNKLEKFISLIQIHFSIIYKDKISHALPVARYDRWTDTVRIAFQYKHDIASANNKVYDNFMGHLFDHKLQHYLTTLPAAEADAVNENIKKRRLTDEVVNEMLDLRVEQNRLLQKSYITIPFGEIDALMKSLDVDGIPEVYKAIENKKNEMNECEKKPEGLGLRL